MAEQGLAVTAFFSHMDCLKCLLKARGNQTRCAFIIFVLLFVSVEFHFFKFFLATFGKVGKKQEFE